MNNTMSWTLDMLSPSTKLNKLLKRGIYTYIYITHTSKNRKYIIIYIQIYLQINLFELLKKISNWSLFYE